MKCRVLLHDDVASGRARFFYHSDWFFFDLSDGDLLLRSYANELLAADYDRLSVDSHLLQLLLSDTSGFLSVFRLSALSIFDYLLRSSLALSDGLVYEGIDSLLVRLLHDAADVIEYGLWSVE